MNTILLFRSARWSAPLSSVVCSAQLGGLLRSARWSAPLSSVVYSAQLAWSAVRSVLLLACSARVAGGLLAWPEDCSATVRVPPKEKKLNRTPTAAEVYFKCHADDSGQFVNNKTKEVWDDFEKKKAVNLECDSETQKSEDDIFFDVVGGWNEKGRVFGLGAAAQSYYEKPTLEERNSKRARRAESLKTQVVDLAAKNDEQKKELDETKEGLNETQAQLDETQKELSETKKTLLETTESFLNFKQVEAFMQTSNPSHP